MKTIQTLGQQLMTLKVLESRRQREKDERAKLIAKYGSPIKPNSPDRRRQATKGG